MNGRVQHIGWCLLGFGLGLGILVLNGCRSGDYTYTGIQQEYAELVCGFSPTLQSSAASNAGSCQLQGDLTLNDAIRTAVTNNPDQKIAQARIVQAETKVARANAAFYPTLGIYSEYMQGDAPSAYLFKTIDQRQLPAGTDFNAPGWFENYETGVKVGWNMFNGGRDRLHKQMALSDLEMSRLDRQGVQNALVAAVIRTYFTALSAREHIQIATESIATVREQLRVMQVRFAAGGALKSDILSLEVRMAQAREEQIRSQNRFNTALAALTNVLGVNPDTPLKLVAADLPGLDLPEDYRAGLSRALEQRPDLRRLRERVRQMRLSLDMARGAYLPRVDAGARYYVDDDDFNVDADRDDWTVAVTLNWALFNGFATRADTRRADAELREALLADHRTLLAVKLDVKNAYLGLQEARARLAVARTTVASGEESLQLVKQQYEGGSATITRYLEAELDRNRSRLRSATAFFDQQMALADVARAIGYWAGSVFPE